MTELTTYRPQTALTEQMEYAKTVATAALLPDSYRGKPADILIAVGLGAAMGLSPAESLYRINVIAGKPTAAAELIAANVRRAGHKLRVTTDDEPSATATIIRTDDPDFEFTVKRDKAWAQAMGLTRKDNYRKQAQTMLQWRAITAVARLACPEALYGVTYTPDEMFDDNRPAITVVEATAPAQDRMRALLTPAAPPLPEPDYIPTPEPEPVDHSEQLPLVDMVTPSQLKKIGAAMSGLGMTDRTAALAYVADVIGRTVESRNELTKAEASTVIDALEQEGKA